MLTMIKGESSQLSLLLQCFLINVFVRTYACKGKMYDSIFNVLSLKRNVDQLTLRYKS
jgi:hypothetical protein